MIISYAGPEGRELAMADVNPGLGALGAATALTLEEYRRVSAPGVTARKPAGREPARRRRRRAAPGELAPGPAAAQPRAAAATPGLAQATLLTGAVRAGLRRYRWRI